MNYPKELFRHDQYRVVHGREEQAKYAAEGWTDQRAHGVEYRVHTAISGPTIREVLAAGYTPEATDEIIEQVEAQVVSLVTEEESTGRKCKICGETGHNARTCEKK